MVTAFTKFKFPVEPRYNGGLERAAYNCGFIKLGASCEFEGASDNLPAG